MFWARNLQIPEMEKLQLGYLKNILNVRKQTPTLAVYAETGRFPLLIRQKLSTVNYWARLSKLPNYDILNKCLKIQEKLHLKGQNNWYSKAMHIITDAKITDWQTIDPNMLVKEIKLNLYTNEQSRILKEINDSDKQPKLRTYKLFKSTYCLEPYLTLNLPKKTYNIT